MRSRRRAFALMVGLATTIATMTIAMGVLYAPSGQAAITPKVACTYPAWAEGTS